MSGGSMSGGGMGGSGTSGGVMGGSGMSGSGKKVLLFGSGDLRTVLAVGAALEPFGADLEVVGPGDHGKTLGVLAGLDPDGTVPEAERDLPVGRMAVLCGLQDELDALLPALARAGAGPGCLKAVLTGHNRSWGPGRLYMELSAEREAVERAREARRR